MSIAETIARAYHDAELSPGGSTGVVPLDALIAAYPLHRAEVPRLSRCRALSYLRRRTGAELPELPGEDEPLAGFLYVYPYEDEVWGCLLVEEEDIIERRRFSAAHELGHYLLHFLPILRDGLRRGEHLFLTEGFTFEEVAGGEKEDALPGAARLYAQDVTGTPLDALGAGQPELEAEANRFAAELLMPETACLTLRQRHRGPLSCRRLAQDLLVSPAAMRVRLSSLGLLS